MKKFFLLTLTLMISNCLAAELKSYNEIKNAAMQGKTLHIVIDFAKCSPLNKKRTPTTKIGIYTPNAIQIVNDRIVTSMTHFTRDHPSFPAKPVVEFIKYSVTDNDFVNVSYQVLKAVNYTPLSDQSSFICEIESGAKLYA